MSNFQAPQVVDDCSETQLQTSENLNIQFSALRVNPHKQQ